MKKNYFLTAVVLLFGFVSTAFAANTLSGTYSGTLTMGTTDLGRGNVDIYPGSTDNTVTFVLPNFNFLGTLPVGDIVLVNVPVENGNLVLTDYPLYLPALEALGQALVSITTREGSRFDGDSLIADIAINVPDLGEVSVLFKGERLTYGFQIPNSGFEEWEDVTSEVKAGLEGQEPTHWNSFVSASTDPDPKMTGFESLLAMALNNVQLADSAITRPGGTGAKSALITSKSVFGIPANGNLTTGRINAGSIDVKSPYNSNRSNPADSISDEFKCPFFGAPDSLSVWVKYRPADGNIDSSLNVAGIKAIIHNNRYYQDPEDMFVRIDSSFVVTDDKTDTILDTIYLPKYDTIKVAQAVTSYKAAAEYAWQRISIPFEYFESDQTPMDSAKWIMVSFSTNIVPGGGTTKSKSLDSIFIDDIELVYRPALLTSLKVGDETVALAEGQYNYSVAQTFNDTTLAVETEIKDATGGKVVKAFNRSASQLVIIVKGGDYAVNQANAQIYTIDFAEKAGVDQTAHNTLVYTDGRILNVETDYQGEIEVYSIEGRLVAKTAARRITLPDAGSYLVMVNGTAHKVMAR